MFGKYSILASAVQSSMQRSKSCHPLNSGNSLPNLVGFSFQDVLIRGGKSEAHKQVDGLYEENCERTRAVHPFLSLRNVGPSVFLRTRAEEEARCPRATLKAGHADRKALVQLSVKAHMLHLHGYNREFSIFKGLDLSAQTSARAGQSATESPWKDTLLSSLGAISADVETQRLFISDTNHHRIIIADGDGKIIDCIGSSPGMEDGPFETAQVCYPASAVYDADRNFLYIADSENHVIRRADLSTRTLSTVEPPKMITKSTIWGRVLRWMGAFQPSASAPESGTAGKCDELKNPWHLKFTQQGLLLVASRCFENIWALDSSAGEAAKFQFQDSEVVSEEFCRKAIDVKEMEDVYSLVLHEMKGNKSPADNPWQIRSVSDIVSRVVRLHNKLFFIDTDGQIIRKYDTDTGSHDTLHLSNLGLLGLPCWWSLLSFSFRSPDGLNMSAKLAESTEREAGQLDNTVHFRPGRCILCINPVLPRGMVLAAPLEDNSIWRQAKGSVVELSMFGGSLISHKISSAQQWLDDLDDLDDPNPETQENEDLTFPPKPESGIPFYTLLDASLGSGEVIIDAVVYFKYTESQESKEELCGPTKGTDMQEWASQTEDQIFLKHLHFKVSLEIATTAPEERTKHISVHL